MCQNIYKGYRNENKSKKDNLSAWTLWTDEDGNWFNPYKPNPNQLELFN